MLNIVGTAAITPHSFMKAIMTVKIRLVIIEQGFIELCPFLFYFQIIFSDKLCKCVQENLEKDGQLKSTTFECVENKELEQIRFVDAKDDGTGSECSRCLNGCRKVSAGNPTENEKTCKIIGGSGVPVEKSVARRTKRAIRVKCYFVFEFKCCFKIRLNFRCVFTWGW